MQVTFSELAGILQASASTVEAAEGHGCLCGALCTSADYTLERWVEELIPESGEPEEGRQLPEGDAQVLQLVFDEAARTLRGDDMEFAPLLPEEDEALERRATALAQWCQGFLYGFGAARTLPSMKLPATVDEVLRDIAHIGGAAVDVGAAGEDEEEAYVEVFEYLRAGVQLVHDELTGLRNDAEDEPSGEPSDAESADYPSADDPASEDHYH